MIDKIVIVMMIKMIVLMTMMEAEKKLLMMIKMVVLMTMMEAERIVGDDN
jgi:hypothetical protein